MSIEIRRLTEADSEIVRMVGPDVFDDDINAGALVRFLTDPRHHLIGALDRGALIGFVSGVHYEHPDKPAPEFWVNEVGVAGSHHRQGIGKRLMAATLAHARALGCLAAWVATDADNGAANALYRSVPGSEATHDIVVYTFPLSDEDR